MSGFIFFCDTFSDADQAEESTEVLETDAEQSKRQS